MSDKGSATAPGGTGLVTAGAVIALVIAAGVYLTLREDGQIGADEVAALEASSGAPVVTAAPLASVQSNTAPLTANETPQEPAVPQSAPDADTAAPRVDEVRVDGSGMMVVAGRAEPGSRVDVVVDGEVVSSADADASGAFAALGNLPSSDTARSLTLSTGAGDSALASEEEIILAPMAAPAMAAVAAAQSPLSPSDEALSAAEMPEALDATAPTAPAQAQEDDAGPQVAEAADAAPGSGADASDAMQQLPLAEDPEVATAPAVSEVDTDVASVAPLEEVSIEQPVTLPAAPLDASPERLPAEGARIAVLRSDDTGVALLETAPASRVVLDTIGYSDTGVVQLSGRASTDAVQVRAYLDNRAVADFPVDASGAWRGEMRDVAAGVYRLRIDALSQTGSVTSRLETPFKREAPAVLAAATQGQQGVPQVITVQTGDTLWAIARDRYGEGVLYVQVFEANRDAIRDPDLIYPGQVFDLPSE